MATKETETGLTIYEGERYMIATEQGRDAGQILSDSLPEGETLDVFDLPIIKVPAGGGSGFDLPGGEVAKTFEGVLILRQPVRAYWQESFAAGGGGSPPDCSSEDAIVGHGNPGGECNLCALSEFGTAVKDDGSEAAGQACRQITRMFILQPTGILPVMLTLPPSSGKAARQYTNGVVGRLARPYWSVVTRVGLESAQSRDGIKFSRARFEVAWLMSPEDAAVFQAYRDSMIGTLRTRRVGRDEVGY